MKLTVTEILQRSVDVEVTAEEMEALDGKHGVDAMVKAELAIVSRAAEPIKSAAIELQNIVVLNGDDEVFSH